MEGETPYGMCKNIGSVFIININFITSHQSNIVIFIGFVKDDGDLYIITNYICSWE